MGKRLALCYMGFLFCTVLTPVAASSQEFQIEKAQKKVVLTGYTRGIKKMTLTAEVTGRVTRVNYDIGSTVGEAPFITIDPTFIDFEIEATRHAQKKLAIAISKITAKIAYLKKEFHRIDLLHQGDRATEVKRDAAYDRLTQTEFERESLLIEDNVLQTNLKQLMERKERHRVFAPEGWVVVRKNVEKGEIINPNKPLAEAADYRQLVVPLFVDTDELKAIQALPSAFNVQVEERDIKASLKWVNPEFNEKTRKLAIEILLNAYSGAERGGLMCRFPIVIDTQGVFIPKQAVIQRFENPRVMLAATREKINVLIIGESGDGFIIAENDRLTPGTRIMVESSQ